MEHVWKVAEALLAIFASMKFAHECFEVVSHVVKLVRK
jgi:hypothetical protein